MVEGGVGEITEKLYRLHNTGEVDAGLRVTIHEQLNKQFPFLQRDAESTPDQPETKSKVGEMLLRSDLYVEKMIESIEDPNADPSRATERMRMVLDGIDVHDYKKSDMGQIMPGHNSFDNEMTFSDLLENADDGERKLIFFNMLIKLLNAPVTNPDGGNTMDFRMTHLILLLNSAQLRGTNADAGGNSYNEQLYKTLAKFIGGISMERFGTYGDESILLKARDRLFSAEQPSKDEMAKHVAAYPVSSRLSVNS